jgi:hypothetical protein
MESIGPSVFSSCLGGRLFCALAGFLIGGFGIGASNSGLAKRRPPPADPEPEQEQEPETEPEEEAEPIEEE